MKSMKSNLELFHNVRLDDLVDRLESYGVDVPGGDQWRDLKTELRVRREPARPANLLDRTADELDAWAREVAAHRLAAARPNHYGVALGDLQPMLDEELKAKIQANGPAIINALRPTFDEAADGIRAAVELGVKPTDTLVSLFTAPETVRRAWLSTHAHAATLDDILSTRQLLSIQAGVPPLAETRGRLASSDQESVWAQIPWVKTITRPGTNGSLGDYNDVAPWERWIALAPLLYLADPTV
jgi:hypothetical protein